MSPSTDAAPADKIGSIREEAGVKIQLTSVMVDDQDAALRYEP